MSSKIKRSSEISTFIRVFIIASGLNLLVSGCATRHFTIETARTAAERGDVRAQYFLATHYFNGEGVPRDYVKAAHFMRAAAENGYVPAENNYGAYCFQGWGMKPDPEKAVHWFQRAAAKGDPLAMYSLGMCYEHGRGIAGNVNEAVKWYRRAALKRQPEAAAALDRIYLSGAAGIPRDYPEAFKWAKLGGELNNADCLNDLGFMYERGLGTVKNPRQAAASYRKAAEQGYFRAYANLGRLYLDGLQLKQNLVTAYKWFLVGMHHGDGISRHYLEEMNLKKLLSDAQKSTAEAQALDYLVGRQKSSGRTQGA